MWNEQKTSAADGEAEAWFGSAVAISGKVALIGAKNATVNGRRSQGAVYTYSELNGVWKPGPKLVVDDGAAGDQAGTVIALMGRTAIITAPFASVNGDIWRGAAYFFDRQGENWLQRQKLVAEPGAIFETFGISVAINSAFAFFGAGGANQSGQYIPRRVYVFRRGRASTTATWAQTQVLDSLIPDDPASSFGGTIALSGERAFIGARAATLGGNIGQGMFYVYKLSGGSWSPDDKVAAPDGAARDNFGVALAIHEDTVLAGAPGATINGNVSQGAVYCMRHTPTGWVQKQKITASDGTAISLFGASISVSGDTMVVGAYADNRYHGAAYVFRHVNGNWVQTDKLVASNGAAGDVFGYYTALDGATALIGAYTAKIGENAKQGAAYFFTRSEVNLGPASKKH